MSWGSVDVETEELTETELTEGDCRLFDRGAGAAAAGERFLPLPNTLPPPSLRAAIVRKPRKGPYVLARADQSYHRYIRLVVQWYCRLYWNIMPGKQRLVTSCSGAADTAE